MRYGIQVWVQKQRTTLNDIERLENKALKKMCFKSKYDTVNSAYKKNENSQTLGYVNPQQLPFHT